MYHANEESVGQLQDDDAKYLCSKCSAYGQMTFLEKRLMMGGLHTVGLSIEASEIL